MLKIHNSRYSKRKLVVGNYGILDFDENGDADANEEIASALKALNGFSVIKEQQEMKKQPIEKDEQVAPEIQKEKLPNFNPKMMSKTWLEDFGKRVYGVEVDKRKSATALYRSLKKLEKEQPE